MNEDARQRIAVLLKNESDCVMEDLMASTYSCTVPAHRGDVLTLAKLKEAVSRVRQEQAVWPLPAYILVTTDCKDHDTVFVFDTTRFRDRGWMLPAWDAVASPAAMIKLSRLARKRGIGMQLVRRMKHSAIYRVVHRHGFHSESVPRENPMSGWNNNL